MSLKNVLLIALLALSLAAHPAWATLQIQVQTGAPALIVRADYIDRFRRPLPGGVAPSGFLSPDGYRFSFDRLGRRIYYVPRPYAIVGPGGVVLPVSYVAVPTALPVAWPGPFPTAGPLPAPSPQPPE